MKILVQGKKTEAQIAIKDSEDEKEAGKYFFCILYHICMHSCCGQLVFLPCLFKVCRQNTSESTDMDQAKVGWKDINFMGEKNALILASALNRAGMK